MFLSNKNLGLHLSTPEEPAMIIESNINNQEASKYFEA